MGLVPGRWRTGLIAVALVLTGAVYAGRQGVSTAWQFVFLRHLGAAAAALCALLAGLFRWIRRADPGNTASKRMEAVFERTALALGVLSAVFLVFEMVVAGLLRADLAGPGGRPFETPANGLLDLGGLTLTVCLSPAARRRVTPLFWVVAAAVCWSGLMIPAALGSTHVVTSWPRWMPWTLWIFVGMSLLLFGFTVAQGVIRQQRRKRAWPDRLEQLTEPHGAWPGFRPSAALIAMGLLALGAYHADSFLVAPCAAMAGGAALRLAHRRWNPNFADVGMALVTLVVVSFVVACVPDSFGGPELATRMPLLLAATMIGLALMIFMWQWLPNVWDQQLHDGRAWTTTGRMLPLARRIGVITASFGALASLQLAFWPEISLTRDDSPARWALGSLANAMLLGSMVLATRLSQRRSLAGLALLSLALAGVYVVVRLPDGGLKFWLIEHWPLVPALIAPLCLGVSQWTDRGRWRPFTGLLESAGVVFFPAVAVIGTIAVSLDPVATLLGKLIYYDAALLRTTTWGILALHYALHACLPGGRPASIGSAVLFSLSIANLGVAHGCDAIAHGYVYLMPIGASLVVLAQVYRLHLPDGAIGAMRVGGLVILLAPPAYRLLVGAASDFAILSIVLLGACACLAVAGVFLRTRLLVIGGAVGGCIDLAAQIIHWLGR